MPADKNVSLLISDFNLNLTNVNFCLEAGLEKLMFYLTCNNDFGLQAQAHVNKTLKIYVIHVVTLFLTVALI
jgi:hypothetical protein